MSKHFRPWKIDQPQLLPPSVQDYVPEDHLSRFIVALVRESLDLSAITDAYTSGLGQPPFDPGMMTALLLNGYASGIYSSRRIAKAAQERADFMMIVALDPPDFRTISDFRKRHLRALCGLFVQVLKLAEKAGLVKLGHVALDGTKIKANASKHKAMSYDRMKKREVELQAEVDRWLAAAEAADAEEDKVHGAKRGDEMPKWVADKAKRLAKIRAAKAELEAEAKAVAQEEARRRAEAEEQRKAEGGKKNGKDPAPPSEEPDPKAQRNFTDPESRILKTKDGYIQGYNAQAAVDGTAQIIVAHGLTPSMSDHGQLEGLIDGIQANLGRLPKEASADFGLSERGQSRRPARTHHPALHRHRPRQASRQRRPSARRPTHPSDAAKAEAGRVAKPVQTEEADRRAGVRADQTGARLPPVPVARRRESACGVGDDLHRPQPRQARQGRVSELSLQNQPGHALSGRAPRTRSSRRCGGPTADPCRKPWCRAFRARR